MVGVHVYISKIAQIGEKWKRKVAYVSTPDQATIRGLIIVLERK